MRHMFLLAASLLLAGGLAVAQDPHGNSTAADPASQSNGAANAAQYQNPDTTTKSASRSTSVIRGCLSGSSGNYTLTDQNGMQYQVSGDDATLRSMVGREVEIGGIESQTSSGNAATNMANGVQASAVRAVSSTCKKAKMSAPPSVDNGVNSSSQANPKAAPEPHNGAKPSSSSPDGTTQENPDRQ